MTFNLRKQLLFILFPIFLSSAKLAAQVNPESINWSNFKGRVDSNSPYDAMTHWGANYRYSFTFTSDTVNLKPTATYFLKDISWVKAAKQSEELLNHERGHYKFAELIALEFLYEVKKNTYLRSTFKQKLDALFNTVLKKYTDMEKVYDNETKHMLDRQSQKKWDDFLNERRRHFNQVGN